MIAVRGAAAVLSLWVTVGAALLAPGRAMADPVDCSTLESRIVAHNADAAKYNSEVAGLNSAGGGNPGQVAYYNSWKARLAQQGAALDAEKSECTPKSKQEYADQAAKLGYTQRIAPQRTPFDSHGEPAYSNGNNYITPDNTGHNVTNGWKMFNRKGKRTGTYNWDLSTRVGD